MKNILCTGNAGYIGSHAAKKLCDLGYNVVGVDNLSRGDATSIDSRVKQYFIDVRETSKLANVVHDNNIECIMHFAALAMVGESVENPLWYYENNVGGMLSILSVINQFSLGSRKLCKKFIFSSTCATYGNNTNSNRGVSVYDKQQPTNPYGWSKLFCEQMIFDKFVALKKLQNRYELFEHDVSATILRYFNVVGIEKNGFAGVQSEKEKRLFSAIVDVLLGKKSKLTINGDNYPTPDGTCVRDYIDVRDLVDAHIAAIDSREETVSFYNLGTGTGRSILDIVKAFETVSGRSIPIEFGTRKAGDPDSVFADPSKAKHELGWSAKRSLLDSVESVCMHYNIV